MPRYILRQVSPSPRLQPRCRAAERTHPLMPSAAIVFRTTSTAPVYVPGAAVCNLVFVKSKGCPTSTQELYISIAPIVDRPLAYGQLTCRRSRRRGTT